jgi:predicted Na+-dependent transporter
MSYATWIRRHGFILGLVLAVVLAFLFPSPGSRHGFLHPELVNNFGIATILFLQGLSLAFEKLKSGAGNWRLVGGINVMGGKVTNQVVAAAHGLPWTPPKF